MAYDEDLADRIREQIGGDPALSEKKMFGGLAFLLGGRVDQFVSETAPPKGITPAEAKRPPQKATGMCQVMMRRCISHSPPMR